MMLPCEVCGGDCTGPRGDDPCPGSPHRAPPPLSFSGRMAARARVESALIESGYILVGMGQTTLVQILDRIIDAARKP